MPLVRVETKIPQYLQDCISEEEVMDWIDEEKGEYPVYTLCREWHRFADAAALLRKGYRMLHVECLEEEFIGILMTLEQTGIYSGDQEAKQELMMCLKDAYMELFDDQIEDIAEEFMGRLYPEMKFDLADVYPDFKGGYIAFTKLLDVFQRDFPVLYQDVVNRLSLHEHCLEILLLCNHTGLVEEFTKRVQDAEFFADAAQRLDHGFDPGQEKSYAWPNAWRDLHNIMLCADDDIFQRMNLFVEPDHELIPNELYLKLGILLEAGRLWNQHYLLEKTARRLSSLTEKTRGSEAGTPDLENIDKELDHICRMERYAFADLAYLFNEYIMETGGRRLSVVLNILMRVWENRFLKPLRNNPVLKC